MLSIQIRKFLLSLTASLPMLLAGCSDTGGSAGDIFPDTEAIALVTPFVGIYDLPDNWSGNPPDEAFLQIQSPDDTGEANALLYDQDDINNCIPERPSDNGKVAREPVGDRVFMDEILAFNESILSLQGSTLIISFKDANDLDGDLDTDEFITLNANRVEVMSIEDLGSGC